MADAVFGHAERAGVDTKQLNLRRPGERQDDDNRASLSRSRRAG